MSRRKGGGRSTAGSIIGLFLALASILTLAWLPLRRGSESTKAVGLLALVGGGTSLVWWIVTYGYPSMSLKITASISGVLYLIALVMRAIIGVKNVKSEGGSQYQEISIRGNEELLFETSARFLGDKRVHVFGGFGFRVAQGFGAGLGLSYPIHHLTVVDVGNILVTNRRIILAGCQRTATLTPKKILSVSVEGDLLIIRPDQGHVLIAQIIGDSKAAATAVLNAVEIS